MKLSFSFDSVRSRLSYGDRTRPTRDWFLLLGTALLLVLMSIGWNFWLLHSVQSGEVIGTETAPAAFDAAPVEEIRALFQARAAEETRYRETYQFVDPSL